MQERKSCQDHIHQIHTIKHGIIDFYEKCNLALIQLLGFGRKNPNHIKIINAAETKI